MTDEQRQMLGIFSDLHAISYFQAVGAALAEIDRLQAELATLKADPPQPAAMTAPVGQTPVPGGLIGSAHAQPSETILRTYVPAEPASADVAVKAEPPRPTTIVRLSGEKWHAFEDQAEARRFGASKLDDGYDAYSVDTWNVREWTWHGKEGTHADDPAGR